MIQFILSRNLRGVAQLVARSVRDAEVVRSSRITPTRFALLIITIVQYSHKLYKQKEGVMLASKYKSTNNKLTLSSQCTTWGGVFMGLKTLSFLTLVLPSLYILLSSLSLPNLVKAEPTNNTSSSSSYLTVNLEYVSDDTTAKLYDVVYGSSLKTPDQFTSLIIKSSQNIGYLVTASTDKNHSNLVRQKNNPNEQDANISPTQSDYNYKTANIVYKSRSSARDNFTIDGSGSDLADNTWGFLPLKCFYNEQEFPCSHDHFSPPYILSYIYDLPAKFFKVPDKNHPVTLKDQPYTNQAGDREDSVSVIYGAKPGSNLPAGTYSTNVVYTVTPKLPPIAPPTISKVINDTHYTTKSDLTAIEGTNLKTATSVFIDFNKDGKADSNELATNLKTYPGTAKEDTVISFNTPVADTPGEYDVYVTTNGGIAKLDQSYIVSKFSPCQSGNAKNDCRVDLDNNMIPVKYTGNTSTPKWESLTNNQAGINGSLPDNQIGQWYDYNNRNWANAVTVKDPNKYKNQNKVIDENDVLGYFVYIPRYSYEVMRPNATDQFVPDSDYTLPDNNLIKHPGFMINFENKYNLFKTPGDSTSCSSISGSTLTTKDYRTQCAKDLGYSRLNPENDSTKTNKTTWATHPAFRWQYTKAINGIDRNHELNGFWVGKYETTGSTTAPTVKPNSKHIGEMASVGNYYDIAKSLGRKDNYNVGGNDTTTTQNNHNLSYYSSHMLKNTEWGAITYLSSSTYGAGLNKVKGNYSNSQGKDGNNEDSEGITGCGPQSEASTSAYDGCNTYNTAVGQLASTTNNPTGVYDMAGGAYEYVMANLTDNPSQITARNDVLVSSPIKPPYVDLYKTVQAGGKFNIKPAWSASNDELDYNNDVCTWSSCGGQALHEIKREQSTNSQSSSWGSAYAYFPNVDDPTDPYFWLDRGGSYNDNNIVGLFYLSPNTGETWYALGFRAVISHSL